MGLIKLSEGYNDLEHPAKMSRPSRPPQPPQPPRFGVPPRRQRPAIGPQPAEPAKSGLPNRYNLTRREYNAVSRRHGSEQAFDVATTGDIGGMSDPMAGYRSDKTVSQMEMRNAHDRGYNSAIQKIREGGIQPYSVESALER